MALNKQFPDVTLIDVADIIIKVQTIITNMTMAISYILFFMLSIGFLVLITSITVNIKQRSHDSAIMRAQGAQSWQIRQMLLMEFVTLGALAGFSAGITSVLSCWILSFWWLTFPIHISLWPIWITPLVSSLLVTFVGYFTSLPVLRSSPMVLLKTF
jgi:putative ABC transport system permease protein